MIPMWYIPNTTSGKSRDLAVPERPYFYYLLIQTELNKEQS